MSNYAKQNRRNLSPSGAIYSPAVKTAARYDVTPMTIYRWERDPELGFPAPVYIGRHKFHVIAELDAWDASRPRGPRSMADVEAAA